ncbi:sarcalumenin [Helicoverpa zea]|uniref:sarcalumenin n=1 Tax=Helicoverpa zea TaxID=7113 RepID=UPI001F5608D4|nr:sarcalumenin [Helicoverpa zea]XP_047034601.1 sarcalumenin [Helicoverpa zea]XP_047034602.1 sarcalumenin [Helicoverpa zea]XP_047034604.1 sarcalumenin [Helicoverpa zea]XP_047034605.1 sarcalumenin [Helicoverpa zea]XP_047034606.1 sarcalumenin [Helicoverpa zea]XP_047034607.1 sarcalumenin [Helicoverpa zea]
MWSKGFTLWRIMLCMLLAVSACAAVVRADDEVPSESQCRPYIEKALKELESGDVEPDSAEKNDSDEVSVADGDDTKEDNSAENGGEAADSAEDDAPSVEIADEPYVSQASVEELQADDTDSGEAADDGDSKEQQAGDADSGEASAEEETTNQESEEAEDETKGDSNEKSQEGSEEDSQEVKEEDSKETEATSQEADDDDKSAEAADASDENKDDDGKTQEEDDGSQEKADESQEDADDEQDSKEAKDDESGEEKAADESGEQDALAEDKDESNEDQDTTTEDKDDSGEAKDESGEEKADSGEDTEEAADDKESVEEKDESQEKDESAEAEGGVEDKSQEEEESAADSKEEEDGDKSEEASEAGEEAEAAGDEGSEEEGAPEEDLLITIDIPENLRSRDHITKILRLDEEASEDELTVEKSADIVLRDLKRLYENSIKPLEGLYKYRDLSNRHFGDPEIFSKPLVLFMGPWSGGKSSILNYLTGLEFTEWSLRTGAEPSPAYFNILMHGKEPQVLDGTQLAADWTFSGLQKFGQGLEERLRGLRYPSKILEKVNIVEIPGILEVRKQVSRVFPFNDACQWFIDRADIIFLVYDPSKLDVGPETEAILDQLKGRESQTRIVLNKADTVKPEELMRVQSALIWNISPLMSSAQPPVMYTVSLWSMPYEAGAPVRLLQAQERELLRDLRQAIDKRIENKIASARRFAVRVRNHAKMVDCYLTTYYNHKTIFGNRKIIADAIIENPQNYHIYEGLSTLTNISRYDLPDPETYRDFFRLNPLFEFQQLSATCTYFRGCPITRLDVAIAYDLPELVGKYKKMVETATPQGMPKS